jgi:hypothetical protein
MSMIGCVLWYGGCAKTPWSTVEPKAVWCVVDEHPAEACRH